MVPLASGHTAQSHAAFYLPPLVPTEARLSSRGWFGLRCAAGENLTETRECTPDVACRSATTISPSPSPVSRFSTSPCSASALSLGSLLLALSSRLCSPLTLPPAFLFEVLCRSLTAAHQSAAHVMTMCLAGMRRAWIAEARVTPYAGQPPLLSALQTSDPGFSAEDTFRGLTAAFRPICSTCDDEVVGGDETGVDCGGSCDACPPVRPSFTGYCCRSVSLKSFPF